MKEVKIDRIEVKDKEVLRECAELYCQTWKEPPWNEDFWTVEGVIEDIKKQMKRSQAIGFLAFCDGKVIGFTWGYEVSKKDLQEISGVTALDILFERSRVFYIDELGVSLSFRKRGVGKQLSKTLIATARNSREIRCFTLRTDVKAVAARNLYIKLGFKDLSVQDAEHSQRTYWVLEFS